MELRATYFGAGSLAGPRGSSRFAMQFLMNLARSAPCLCCESAPNLQVAILSLLDTASAGVLTIMAANVAAAMA